MAKTSTTKRLRAPATILEADLRRLELDIIRLVAFVRDHPIKLLKSGAPSKAFFKKATEACANPSLTTAVDHEIYLAFLVSLLHSADILVAGESVLEANAMVLEEHLSSPASERLERLRNAWLQIDDFNEFLSIPTLEVSASKNQAMVSTQDSVPGVERIRQIRTTICEHLRDLPTQRWLSIDNLSDQISEKHPDLLIRKTSAGRFEPPKYYHGVRERGSKNDLLREGNWSIVEGALIEFLVRLPLYVLGYADIGDTQGGEKLALRLRDFELSEHKHETDKHMIVQPNFEILAFMPEMSTRQLWHIIRYSSITSFDDVTHLKLEERFIAQAVNEGQSVSDIVAYLEAHSKTGMPQNLSYSIESWAQKAQRITIHLDAILFEAEGNEDLQRIIREPYLKRASLTSLDSKHLVGSVNACPPPSEGVAPRYPSFDYSRSIPSNVGIDSEGIIMCLSENANFRLYQGLVQLADRESLDRWRITRESFGRAIDKGLPYDAALELLGSILNSEIPPAMQIKLRAWADRIEAGYIRKTTLLEFQQPEVVDLLRRVAKERNLPIVALNDTTFEVDEEELDHVLQTLGELSLNTLQDDEE